MAHIWDFVKTCFETKNRKTEIIKRVIEVCCKRTTQDFLKSYPLEHRNQPLRHAIKITRRIKRSQLRWRNVIEWNSLVHFFNIQMSSGQEIYISILVYVNYLRT